ncbi:putative GntR family transcriptional regulator [Microlunatus phosphovorus NM-1]|uniref:Putative GntR family transcriptional regulator n=1 Tax=Microlunatus phosphovorus (strain ATCC 700054 / DSM 10555 / JCM 9379 / NBRC 101784 / NCIMB 13414 / VKM Ac-1990 / NM-1) TaxID=1032480 RepID=F5XG31_MICPN|nr:GntR family transcriptional regulator [Microlunatus phosphovorus]BAK37965.1 putative GntR family transcriptional regulator [Microlunatus phosphovorus NM-1]
MTGLDPDDPRPPYIQVANVLRAAILTRKLEPGEKLPSQADLAERYGVARMTIQQSLRLLREEKLIVSRQGSGVFVRERTARPVGLRPHIEAAFEKPDVQIDFSGYTAETLHTAIQEPLDKIRNGLLTPETIHVRLLLSDMSVPMAIPSRAGDDPGDDPRVRARMERTATRYAGGIAESVSELAQLQLVQRAGVEVKVHSSAPLFKLYLINGSDLFFGFYPVREHEVTLDGDQVAIFDPMGKDTELFHHTSGEPDSIGTLYLSEAAKWFDSIWTTIARPWQP